MVKGKVKFWNNRQGWGLIESKEYPQEKIYINFTEINSDAKVLLEREIVEFEVQRDSKGLRAQNLRRSIERLRGIVDSFEMSYGYIKELNSGEKFFVHANDVRDNSWLDVNQEVEFEPIPSNKRLRNASKVIAIDPRYPLEKFADLGSFDATLNDLAQLAQDEDWDYVSPERRTGKKPVLFSYVHYTFIQIQAESKIAFATDRRENECACFNTGLATDKQEEIFAYFERNSVNPRKSEYLKSPDWNLKKFVTENDPELFAFERLPEVANYFEDSSDLIYEMSKGHPRRLVISYEHILDDREDRFPDSFKGMSPKDKRDKLESAIRKAEKRVKRNYKAAIPQFYRGSIDLLLPLCIESDEKVDLALVVSRNGEVYEAKTVLPLDWAYRNARLLARPDREWLNP